MGINISGKQFNNEMANQSWTPSTPVVENPAMAGQVFDTAASGLSQQSNVLLSAAEKISDMESRSEAVDMTTQFDSWARTYTMSKREISGKNAIGLSGIATKDMEEAYSAFSANVVNPKSQAYFKQYSRAIINSHLDVLANHELAQIGQYRNDVTKEAYNNTLESIKLSTGDTKVVNEIISSYEKQLDLLYPEQDTTYMKVLSRSQLERAGRESENRFLETKVYGLVRSKFSSTDEKGRLTMDYNKMSDYLYTNPDNDPSIAKMTIQERMGLAASITADGARAKQAQKEVQETNSSLIWNNYMRLLTGDKLRENDAGSFMDLFRKVQEMSSRGDLDDSVAKNMITLREQQIASIRSAASAANAIAAQGRANQQFAWAIAAHSPFMMSDQRTLAQYTQKVTNNPLSVTPTELDQLVGRGLSISDAESLKTKIKGAPQKAWSSPIGKLMKENLKNSWKNNEFGSVDEENNSGYNTAIGHFEKWMLENPNADAAKADAELRRYMYPITTGWIQRKIDERIYGIKNPILPRRK